MSMSVCLRSDPSSTHNHFEFHSFFTYKDDFHACTVYMIFNILYVVTLWLCDLYLLQHTDLDQIVWSNIQMEQCDHYWKHSTLNTNKWVIIIVAWFFQLTRITYKVQFDSGLAACTHCVTWSMQKPFKSSFCSVHKTGHLVSDSTTLRSGGAFL